MNGDIIQTVVIGTLATAGTGFLGMTAWGVRRMISKQDRLDLLVRGDGNGILGLGERIRDVHQDVAAVREEQQLDHEDHALIKGALSTLTTKFDAHAEGEEARIIAVWTARTREEEKASS